GIHRKRDEPMAPVQRTLGKASHTLFVRPAVLDSRRMSLLNSRPPRRQTISSGGPRTRHLVRAGNWVKVPDGSATVRVRPLLAKGITDSPATGRPRFTRPAQWYHPCTHAKTPHCSGAAAKTAPLTYTTPLRSIQISRSSSL